MSTFCGHMQEYCNVSIDKFDGENLQSTAFFLSHCHQDHMQGLTSTAFSYHLDSSSQYHLYVSDVTKVLLESDERYTHLQKHLVVLPINQPSTLRVPDKVTGQDELITVTLIPAGHCLGSVMFLFEGKEGTVLYTGDFRLPLGGPSRISALLSGVSPKHLKSLYIDTTFCVPKARHIPSREESADAIVTLIEGWIYQSKFHVVKLITKAAYSYEQLFDVVYKKFGKKVHVTEQRHSQYQLIPGLSECTTTDPAETQIHACTRVGRLHEKGNWGSLSCGYTPPNGEELKLMVIQPSTMWFMQSVGMADIVKELASKYRVCYCFHPSYNEVQEFVGFFRPEKVFPNVKPIGYSMKEVQATLDMFRTNGPGESGAADGDFPMTPVKKSLGKLKKLKRKKIESFHGSSEGLLFDDDEIIPKKRARPSSDNQEDKMEEEQEKDSHKDEHSDAESYHTNSYKGSDDDGEDILRSDDDAEPDVSSKSGATPPVGSLLSYISDDDDDMLENDVLSHSSPKLNGFVQSADMFEDDSNLCHDLLSEGDDMDKINGVEADEEKEMEKLLDDCEDVGTSSEVASSGGGITGVANSSSSEDLGTSSKVTSSADGITGVANPSNSEDVGTSSKVTSSGDGITGIANPSNSEDVGTSSKVTSDSNRDIANPSSSEDVGTSSKDTSSGDGITGFANPSNSEDVGTSSKVTSSRDGITGVADPSSSGKTLCSKEGSGLGQGNDDGIAENCSKDGAEICESERISPVQQNTSLLDSSCDHSGLVDTDATTVCSQPLSQHIGSDEGVELDRSAGSSAWAMNFKKQTARKSMKGSSPIKAESFYSGIRNSDSGRSPGCRVVEIIDLTADDSDGSDAEVIGEDGSDSSVVECGDCSDDYEGDESFCDEDGELIDSDDDSLYFHQHEEIYDSDVEECFDCDDDEDEEEEEDEDEVIIVDSRGEGSVSVAGEVRQIARVCPFQSRRLNPTLNLGEELSSSSNDVVLEHEQGEDDSDVILEGGKPDHIAIARDVVTLDSSVIHIDGNVVDLDSTGVSADDAMNPQVKSVNTNTCADSIQGNEVTEIDENSLVVDINHSQVSHDLFSSDSNEHILLSDAEAANDLASSKGSGKNADAATTPDADVLDKDISDDDKLLDSDHDEKSADVCVNDVLLADVNVAATSNENRAKCAEISGEVSPMNENPLNSGVDPIMSEKDSQMNDAEVSCKSSDLGLVADLDPSEGLDDHNSGVDPIMSEKDSQMNDAVVSCKSSDLGLVADLDPSEGLDDHLLFSDPEDGKNHAGLSDADLDPKLLD